jgi:hypothetical protein
MLAELYMSMDNYQQAIGLIDDTHKRLSTQALPLDLTINFGICQAHMGNIVLAEVRLTNTQLRNIPKHVWIKTNKKTNIKIKTETIRETDGEERELVWRSLL